jgi:FtsH-binding integral membrane protein
MVDNTNQVPRAAIKGIAFGILLMAVFTTVWLGIASSALSGVYHWFCIGILLAVLVCFVVCAVRLFIQSKEFPPTRPEDKAEGSRMQIWYGVIFGLEGLFIGAACGILGSRGLNDYIVPTIALIVGLHFYPMATVFSRKFDYFTGTWTTVVAFSAIILETKKLISVQEATIMVGMGTAIATISYGIFMMSEAKKYKVRLKG